VMRPDCCCQLYLNWLSMTTGIYLWGSVFIVWTHHSSKWMDLVFRDF
jgi:hypothetical protein